jgi:hypothetical protein
VHNAGSVAAGALGVVGGVLAVRDVANELAGRVEVELEGLDPADFDVDHEWKGVPLGEDEKGTRWWCTIRVERSILFRKYVVDVYLMA